MAIRMEANPRSPEALGTYETSPKRLYSEVRDERLRLQQTLLSFSSEDKASLAVAVGVPQNDLNEGGTVYEDIFRPFNIDFAIQLLQSSLSYCPNILGAENPEYKPTTTLDEKLQPIYRSAFVVSELLTELGNKDQNYFFITTGNQRIKFSRKNAVEYIKSVFGNTPARNLRDMSTKLQEFEESLPLNSSKHMTEDTISPTEAVVIHLEAAYAQGVVASILNNLPMGAEGKLDVDNGKTELQSFLSTLANSFSDLQNTILQIERELNGIGTTHAFSQEELDAPNMARGAFYSARNLIEGYVHPNPKTESYLIPELKMMFGEYLPQMQEIETYMQRISQRAEDLLKLKKIVMGRVLQSQGYTMPDEFDITQLEGVNLGVKYTIIEEDIPQENESPITDTTDQQENTTTRLRTVVYTKPWSTEGSRLKDVNDGDTQTVIPISWYRARGIPLPPEYYTESDFDRIMDSEPDLYRPTVKWIRNVNNTFTKGTKIVVNLLKTLGHTAIIPSVPDGEEFIGKPN